ncbi:MAG: cellobiose phosphorylase [Butyrivibrio sp.]|nr:cellobiose phosphorylase [Butyrivibrio sp.]
MNKPEFIDNYGSFSLKNPQHTSGLYLPVAGRKELKSAVAPDFGGDAKLDQNHFLLQPKSIMNLQSDRDTRNFFCVFSDGLWSATGVSASQEADRFTEKEEEVLLTAGRMWQETSRTHKDKKLTAKTLLFALLDENAEVMSVEFTNESGSDIEFTPVAAVPIYGRSADNLRDHRHVTSLLHRAKAIDNGIVVKPTLSFDERGHQINDTFYYVLGFDDKGGAPETMIADVEKYLGEGGTYLRPASLIKGCCSNDPWKKAPFETDGKEMIGALKFKKITLSPGQSVSYRILIGAETGCHLPLKEISPRDEFIRTIADKASCKKVFEDTKKYWQELIPIHVKTSDPAFDSFMEWICFQPQLRRIFGCSFLPHHDYGRGGRGWRDLWQDCLALLLTDPDVVREMILNNFKGVRLDGTNATIIGDKPGEFKGDRNGIPRVWMDHGFWPFLTLKLYMDQTGDLDILSENVTYFKDTLTHRADKRDNAHKDEDGVIQKTADGSIYEGTVLEHLLMENLTSFYDVGDHNEIKLRNADWNDALDMAEHKGESVAFTCGYAGNLKDIAEVLKTYKEKTGVNEALICTELKEILFADDAELFGSPDKKRALLDKYMDKVSHTISGDKESLSIDDIAEALLKKSGFMMNLIRDNEWVTDSEGNGWFNGYYDDNGNRVEGEYDTPDGKNIRMMLTGQVFSVMSGTAKEESVKKVIASADKYLYEGSIGGYRLNTDFKELRTDLGRMFGFSYGDKENGAVFSHMAVMFGNALYKRGFAKEGFKALDTLYRTASDFETSRIYPGVPEYFNNEGRGLYNYLTGAASWYMMTVITESFGVRGDAGDLCIEPKLMKDQFDKEKKASVRLKFRGKALEVVIKNSAMKDYGEYSVKEAVIDGNAVVKAQGKRVCISADMIDNLAGDKHRIEVEL